MKYYQLMRIQLKGNKLYLDVMTVFVYTKLTKGLKSLHIVIAFHAVVF